ncbi:hypothetical protein IJM86_03070 [bacterium]|nr:hypothetical protein [bacterium]
MLDFLKGVSSFTITSDGKQYSVKYINGRKDVVLGRMFEDGYITQEELKKAFIEGFDCEFRTSTFQIKAPHFVFRIKSLLEKKY